MWTKNRFTKTHSQLNNLTSKTVKKVVEKFDGSSINLNTIVTDKMCSNKLKPVWALRVTQNDWYEVIVEKRFNNECLKAYGWLSFSVLQEPVGPFPAMFYSRRHVSPWVSWPGNRQRHGCCSGKRRRHARCLPPCRKYLVANNKRCFLTLKALLKVYFSITQQNYSIWSINRSH